MVPDPQQRQGVVDDRNNPGADVVGRGTRGPRSEWTPGPGTSPRAAGPGPGGPERPSARPGQPVRWASWPVTCSMPRPAARAGLQRARHPREGPARVHVPGRHRPHPMPGGGVADRGHASRAHRGRGTPDVVGLRSHDHPETRTRRGPHTASGAAAGRPERPRSSRPPRRDEGRSGPGPAALGQRGGPRRRSGSTFRARARGVDHDHRGHRGPHRVAADAPGPPPAHPGRDRRRHRRLRGQPRRRRGRLRRGRDARPADRRRGGLDGP